MEFVVNKYNKDEETLQYQQIYTEFLTTLLFFNFKFFLQTLRKQS